MSKPPKKKDPNALLTERAEADEEEAKHPVTKADPKTDKLEQPPNACPTTQKHVVAKAAKRSSLAPTSIKKLRGNAAIHRSEGFAGTGYFAPGRDVGGALHPEILRSPPSPSWPAPSPGSRIAGQGPVRSQPLSLGPGACFFHKKHGSKNKQNIQHAERNRNTTYSD